MMFMASIQSAQMLFYKGQKALDYIARNILGELEEKKLFHFSSLCF